MSIVTTTRPALARAVDPRIRGIKPAAITSTIDPIRVLRRHVITIIIALAVGAVLGVGSYYAFSKFYPLYTSSVMFEVRPGLQQSTDLGTADMTNDDMVFRMAQTETFLLSSPEILGAALRDPDIRKTEWSKQFIVTNSDGSESFNDEDALDKLVKEIWTSVGRSSNLFGVFWKSHVPSDVP